MRRNGRRQICAGAIRERYLYLVIDPETIDRHLHEGVWWNGQRQVKEIGYQMKRYTPCLRMSRIPPDGLLQRVTEERILTYLRNQKNLRPMGYEYYKVIYSTKADWRKPLNAKPQSPVWKMLRWTNWWPLFLKGRRMKKVHEVMRLYLLGIIGGWVQKSQCYLTIKSTRYESLSNQKREGIFASRTNQNPVADIPWECQRSDDHLGFGWLWLINHGLWFDKSSKKLKRSLPGGKPFPLQ